MSIKLGVLGFAHGHVNMYCDQWRKNPDWGMEVVAGWDHDAARLEKAVAAHGLKPYFDVDALLTRADVQAVVVSA
ncbi:MAG: hypothetical protein NTX50_25855 [Candidatus Sumerlaeota bacterium]|nr:hypothetical protein [Candidatus Sumerlaeota bacterium]